MENFNSSPTVSFEDLKWIEQRKHNPWGLEKTDWIWWISLSEPLIQYRIDVIQVALERRLKGLQLCVKYKFWNLDIYKDKICPQESTVVKIHMSKTIFRKSRFPRLIQKISNFPLAKSAHAKVRFRTCRKICKFRFLKFNFDQVTLSSWI